MRGRYTLTETDRIAVRFKTTGLVETRISPVAPRFNAAPCTLVLIR